MEIGEYSIPGNEAALQIVETTIMRKWKWLFRNGCELKSLISPLRGSNLG
jgi:hypothetical protein